MTQLPENLKENDFYLVRSGAYKWFNLIVRIRGESPFFTLEAWDVVQGTICKPRNYELTEWGPKICSSELLTPLTKSENPL